MLTCSVTVRVHVSVAPDLPPVGLPIDVPTVEPLRSVTVFVRVAAPGEHDEVGRPVSVDVLLLGLLLDECDERE